MRAGAHAARGPQPAAFEAWVEGLFARARAEFEWREIARALGALSQDYVQRRTRLQGGRGPAVPPAPRARPVLAGRGKRAAFQLYYGPRHFLVVREILRALDPPRPARVVDLGCGTGVAGVAWCSRYPVPPPLLGVDTAAWALEAARATARTFGVGARTLCCPLERLRWPAAPLGIAAAFTVNELDESLRTRLLGTLLEQARSGSAVLVVEPLATRVVGWWDGWAAAFAARGGASHLWRFDVPQPEAVMQLGRSAGLDPRELGARSLWLAPASCAAGPQDASPGVRAPDGAPAPVAVSKRSKASR